LQPPLTVEDNLGGEVMKNLESEMKRYGVTVRDICTVTGIKQERTARYKVKGTTPFTLPQAMQIRDAFFPSLRLEYLFAQDTPSSPHDKPA